MLINITIKCAPKNFLCFAGPLRDRLNKGLNLPRYDRYNFQGM